MDIPYKQKVSFERIVLPYYKKFLVLKLYSFNYKEFSCSFTQVQYTYLTHMNVNTCEFTRNEITASVYIVSPTSQYYY